MSHVFNPDPYYCSSTAVMANGSCPEPFNVWELLSVIVIFIIFASAMIWFSCWLAKKILKKKLEKVV